ncbi:MAG: hypothetical protein FWD61_18990 [Phycisphaerales bacterium]|nr:hypothetical protein [Phycisphaerales bacterium]
MPDQLENRGNRDRLNDLFGTPPDSLDSFEGLTTVSVKKVIPATIAKPAVPATPASSGPRIGVFSRLVTRVWERWGSR